MRREAPDRRAAGPDRYAEGPDRHGCGPIVRGHVQTVGENLRDTFGVTAQC